MAESPLDVVKRRDATKRTVGSMSKPKEKISSGKSGIEKEAKRIERILQKRGFAPDKIREKIIEYQSRPKDNTIMKKKEENNQAWKARFSKKYEKDASGKFIRKQTSPSRDTTPTPPVTIQAKPTPTTTTDKELADEKQKTQEETQKTEREKRKTEKEKQGFFKRFFASGKEKTATGWPLFLLALLLWTSDYYTGFNGFNIDRFITVVTHLSIQTWLFILFNLFALTAIITRPFFKQLNLKNDLPEYISWIIFVWTISLFIWISRDFVGAPKSYGAFFHIAFALFALIMLKSRTEKTEARFYRGFVLFIFLDFFLLSIILKIVGLWGLQASELFIIPFWVLYTLYYTHQTGSEKSKKLSGFLIFLVVILLLASNGVAIREVWKTRGYVLGVTETGEPRDLWSALKETGKVGLNTIEDFVKKGQEKLNESFYYDTKDYYTGKVDSNVKEPLGVYITNIETLDPIVYEDEEIELWATIRAKSIEEPIETIKVGCVADAHMLDGRETGTSKVTEFRNFIDDEEDIDCKFPANKLEKGSHLITFTAEFDFTTLAYLKTYFIDDSRLKAFIREDIDVFKEYGITDKNPIAVYTNGPVGIGMETKTPPIGISYDYDTTPKFGITIENKWQGMILEINNLIVYLPDGLELEDYCDGAFQDLSNPQLEQEGYKAYEFVKGLTQYKDWIDIEAYVSRKCRLKIQDPRTVLGETPIAVRYIKARVDYTYRAEQSTNINVKTPRGFNVYFDPKEPTSNDDLKCIASHSNSYIIKAPYEIYINEELMGTPENIKYCGEKKSKCDIITISKSKFKRGDEIKCKVLKATLSNDQEDSDSMTVKIKNSAPTIKKIEFENSQPTINDPQLKCIGYIEDKDNDEMWVTYEVNLNDAKISYEYLDPNPRWENNNQQFVITINLAELKNNEGLKEGNRIYCKMTAIDAPKGDYERKESEPKDLSTTISKPQTTTTTSINLNADCSDWRNDMKACGGSTVMNCYKLQCMISCNILAIRAYNENNEKSDVIVNNKKISPDWSCACNMDDWTDEECKASDGCLVGHCPGRDYCCSPTATP